MTERNLAKIGRKPQLLLLTLFVAYPSCNALTPSARMASSRSVANNSVHIKTVSRSKLLVSSSSSLRRSNVANFGSTQEENEKEEECELFSMGYNTDFFVKGKDTLSTIVVAAADIKSMCLPQPDPELIADDVVKLCMDFLQINNKPCPNAGLQVCFSFSSDRCRAALGGSIDNFIIFANNPVFGSMIGATFWQFVSIGTEIPGTATRGAMKTLLVNVIPARGRRERRFLWTMQKERRPPRQGCWLVHECICVENAYDITL